MFERLYQFFKNICKIKDLKTQIFDLEDKLNQILKISEKYLYVMKTRDKIQLLILRKNILDKSGKM